MNPFTLPSLLGINPLRPTVPNAMMIRRLPNCRTCGATNKGQFFIKGGRGPTCLPCYFRRPPITEVRVLNRKTHQTRTFFRHERRVKAFSLVPAHSIRWSKDTVSALLIDINLNEIIEGNYHENTERNQDSRRS
jgi:hypothetical protein